VAACGTREKAAEADPDPAGAARSRIGVIFDPSSVRVGDTIAGVVVERVSVTRAVVDSSYVGDITFRGKIELSGRKIPHFEADVSGAACFEADSVSAARMPRWAGDRRRTWFCFSNLASANRALGPSSTGPPVRIVIDDFTIHRGLSDQVNSARFVRLVKDSASIAGSNRALDSAAKEIVAFLQGKRPFDRIALADTVVLYISPEGGGNHAAVARENLRTPASWSVQSDGRRYSFVPPSWTRMTTRPGRHFNCAEYSLATRFMDLAMRPHVGVKLEPDRPASCLESWNSTFVFDTAGGRPELIAAVYDQWEW